MDSFFLYFSSSSGVDWSSLSVRRCSSFLQQLLDGKGKGRFSIFMTKVITLPPS
jgi:hypothetical protein